MDRKPCGQYRCKHHKLIQTLRSRLCRTLSLPVVNAATLYQRITPTDETNEESGDVTLREDLGRTLKTELKVIPTHRVERKILSDDGHVVYVPQEENISGWQSIKQAYSFEQDSNIPPLEIKDLVLLTVISFGLGFIYGGLPASHIGRKRYMEKSQGVAYLSRFNAVSDSHNAGIRGLIRYGMRWGWRVTFIATSFHLLSTCLSFYRNKVDLWNYGIAGVSTGAMYRFNLGVRGMIGGGVAGLVVGIPAGFSLLLFQKMSGMTSLERYRQHRADLIEHIRKVKEMSEQDNKEAIEFMDKWLKEKEQETGGDKTKR